MVLGSKTVDSHATTYSPFDFSSFWDFLAFIRFLLWRKFCFDFSTVNLWINLDLHWAITESVLRLMLSFIKDASVTGDEFQTKRKGSWSRIDENSNVSAQRMSRETATWSAGVSTLGTCLWLWVSEGKFTFETKRRIARSRQKMLHLGSGGLGGCSFQSTFKFRNQSRCKSNANKTEFNQFCWQVRLPALPLLWEMSRSVNGKSNRVFQFDARYVPNQYVTSDQVEVPDNN